MTGIAPVDGYAVGFHLGAEARKTCDTYRVEGAWPTDKQAGYTDGWEWATRHALDAVERGLVAKECQLHKQELLVDFRRRDEEQG